MKVLHIYRTYFPDPPGGLQEAIRQIALSTRTCGVEPRIFTLSPTPRPPAIDFPEGRVVRAKSWAAPASCDLGGIGSLTTYREMADWADVVHFHFPWPFADVLHLLGATKKPTVMTYHSDVVRQKVLGAVYGPLMRRTLRSMSAVVATSPAYAQTSETLAACVQGERLKTIPLGIIDYRDAPHSQDTERDIVSRLGLANGEPYFLALGVLRYYKGLHTLVEAARVVNAKIVIAGSGPERERLSALARQTGATNVVFAGQVTHEEKVVLLRNCRAMVLPSHLRSEAFGMVLVEAEMFGKPMVCCEVGSGTSYVNENGVTGFVVAPEAPQELARAMNALLDDDALAVQMGRAARERYEALFSGLALGRAYGALYREIAPPGRKG
ncbi:glycosyl transferase [Paraburkholderia graminis]|uniref:Glycosyl transferase group 1 n=1 Tax=Paraburkholderia graminis (strain ATCC 700544 / DSM 17151 / LMG 18924 / NCIMB 13744 / C4D1M) TaxID=396598 RepID=B1FXL6_PARG4|nr:glycosyltransferase [Paraburkholderia graminis]AXF07062.1 glycosyl transferase [Paraburkholderia graminis]EDT11559.1 glycosyl transferase group 1 [Paraburkholderia graminis C4D1M]CAB3670715.1 Alpha-D-kanosaminyltransferase [Paraburkholderia graminis C4D1M]